MAYPFPDSAGFVPLAGPNGTVQLPPQFAPVFGLPTFAPGEVENASVSPALAPLPTDPSTPAPSVAGAPTPPPAFTPAPQPKAPAAPAPPTLADATDGVNRTIESVRQRQATEVPQSAAGMAMGALGDKRALLQAESEVEGALGREEERIYKEQAASDERATKQRDAERERWQKEDTAARAGLQSAQDAYVNHKEDRGRWWSSRTTGQKIMAGIGIAMAGLGGALVARDTGRPATNPALDLIMGAIEDDTRQQLRDRDKLAATVGMKRDAISDLRQRYQDGEAAYQGILAGNLRRTQTQVAAAAASAKDPQAKLKLESLSADIGIKAAEVQQSAEDRELAAKQADRAFRLQAAGNALAERRFNREAFESDRSFAEGQRQFNITAGLDAEKARLAAEAKAREENSKLTKEERERSVGSGYGSEKRFLTRSSQSAERISPIVAAGARAASAIDGLRRLRDDKGAEWFKTEAARQAKADFAAVILELKNVGGLGVLAGPDMDIIKDFMGGTGDVTEFDVADSIISGLDRARTNTVAKVRAELSAAGVENSNDWDPPDMSKRRPGPEDAAVATASVTAPGQSPGLVNKLTPRDEDVVRSLGGADSPDAQAYIRRTQGGFDARQESVVNAVANAAAFGKTPEIRATMRERLSAIAKADSTPPGLRAYAAEALKQIDEETYKAPYQNVFGGASTLVDDEGIAGRIGAGVRKAVRGGR